MIKIHALSVKQPFATWLVDGTKIYEHRSRQTHFRGEVVIHSSRVPDLEFMHEYGLVGDLFRYPNGCLIGTVEISDCRDLGNGRFAWKVQNARMFKQPIPASGMLGIWEIPEHIEQEIKREQQ